MITMTFTTRETYLAYRTEWKARYADLSRMILESKLAIKDLARDNIYAGNRQNKLRAMQTEATEMLLQLAEAKKLADQQYQAVLTEVA